jgi:hypothetical protein
MSERAGQRISFVKFMLYGIPVTLVSLVVATVYVLGPVLLTLPKDRTWSSATMGRAGLQAQKELRPYEGS